MFSWIPLMNTTIPLGLDNSHILCDYSVIPLWFLFCPFVLQVLSLNMSSNHHNYSAEHRNDEMRVCSFCHNLVYKLAMEIFRHCFKETLYLGFVFLVMWFWPGALCWLKRAVRVEYISNYRVYLLIFEKWSFIICIDFTVRENKVYYFTVLKPFCKLVVTKRISRG